MKRVHFFSGLTISIFVGFHLLNHSVSVFGTEDHIELMHKLRLVYRNFLIETILLTAIFFQIVSGIKLFFSKRKSVVNFYEKLQIWTGLYLALFLVIHVSAVLFGRYILNLDTNFYFGVAGLNTWPLKLFFVPYYGLAVISFYGHIASLHYHKMKRRLFGLTTEQQSKIILVKGIVVTVIIFYGLTNGFTGVEIPEKFDVVIGK
ncbi:hypothetical protein [Desertivirga xinjiangensis]|uniref:hypothetical protein n=1 Tax=Desertivirga xinjiangensis TaxID=539206 RepID=UPI00210A69E9|nr:hypothetical protein [Pedobacter xinjiangensis]